MSSDQCEHTTLPAPGSTSRSSSAEISFSVKQLREYHAVLGTVEHIKSLSEAVNHPGGNLMWDSKRNKCVPGRVWIDKAPPHIIAELQRPFTDDEIAAIRRDCRFPVAPPSVTESEASLAASGAGLGVDGTEAAGRSATLASGGDATATADTPTTSRRVPRRRPHAILLIGPSASGKSYIKPKIPKFLRVDLTDFAEIDGHEIRSHHAGWAAATSDPTVGFKDLWSHFRSRLAVVKKALWREALQHKYNLIIPWTASNVGKTLLDFERLRSAGYKIDVVGLVAAYAASRDRMLNRAHMTGRWGFVTREKWTNGMTTLMILAQPDRSASCIIFENTDTASPRLLFTRTQTMLDCVRAINAKRAEAGLDIGGRRVGAREVGRRDGNVHAL
eukprot:TRINITY_DN32965_c0_g1_i1.p1 TRINITY_DN32965_c0_g1~~TRINITY_DN32965_c0_g1_i1.p1  ORF type:complete len:388 (-),score=57.83 TRINITY_DN32965_c0_g1_i1:4-1167(-)